MRCINSRFTSHYITFRRDRICFDFQTSLERNTGDICSCQTHSLGFKYTKMGLQLRGSAANSLLVYLEPTQRVWWLMLSPLAGESQQCSLWSIWGAILQQLQRRKDREKQRKWGEKEKNRRHGRKTPQTNFWFGLEWDSHLLHWLDGCI